MNYNKLTKKELIQALTSIVDVPPAEIQALEHDYTKKEVLEVLLQWKKKITILNSYEETA